MDAPLVTPTLDDPHTLGDLLGVTPGEALAVVVATILMYVAFLALQRLLGQRVFSGLSSVNITVAAVLGAIVGRATMGHTPTLAAGVIALVTLFCLEGLISRLSRWAPVDRLVNNRPVLLMAGPRPITTHLERYHVTDTELRTALRLAGVTAAGQVAAVVLEPTGAMSVLRRGTPIDPRLLAEVRGWELVPAEFVAGGREGTPGPS